jgi:hypothetical protein
MVNRKANEVTSRLDLPRLYENGFCIGVIVIALNLVSASSRRSVLYDVPRQTRRSNDLVIRTETKGIKQQPEISLST